MYIDVKLSSEDIRQADQSPEMGQLPWQPRGASGLSEPREGDPRQRPLPLTPPPPPCSHWLGHCPEPPVLSSPRRPVG